MDNKTTTKFVIENNDKFLKFSPTGISEQSDPVSATIYSSPGKAKRRLTSLANDNQYSGSTLIAIDFTWNYAVPSNIEAETAETVVDPT